MFLKASMMHMLEKFVLNKNIKKYGKVTNKAVVQKTRKEERDLSKACLHRLD